MLEHAKKPHIDIVELRFRGPGVTPDPGDTPFLEAAISSRAYALITGNKRHFPKSACQGLVVFSPKEFFAHLGKGPHFDT